jgi:hypothetical protein
MIPNNSQTILINYVSYVPETEKQKVEEELENYKRKLKDAEVRINIMKTEQDRTSLSINSYINTERILREENEKLNKKIIDLENENIKLKNIIENLNQRIENLENKELEKQKILMISQCVYDFKEKIWILIFQTKKEKTRMQTNFGRDILRKILDGFYDNDLTKQQLVIKNKISNNIKKDYQTIDYFFNCLNMITDERNNASHPKIEQYDVLREDFLHYCNEIWEDDEDINTKFTNCIFSVLNS